MREPSPATADLARSAGLPIAIDDGRPVLSPDLLVEERRTRRRRELAGVAEYTPGLDADGEIAYWMLNGVLHPRDADLTRHALRYELTILSANPLGREAPKTMGHRHVRPEGASVGYPEIMEIVHGEAGVLFQDLAFDGADQTATFAVLVQGGVGDWIVLPPDLHHVTINLGPGPLVFSDVIDRRATAIYQDVKRARGFAWYLGADGSLRANPAYRRHPELRRIDAPRWSGASEGILYERFTADPGSFDWLSSPESFHSRHPGLWARVSSAIVPPAVA